LQIHEKEVLQDYVETRKIPQVKAAYTYRGQGMTIEKGEVIIEMFLWHCLHYYKRQGK
jgi:hypothetical protein